MKTMFGFFSCALAGARAQRIAAAANSGQTVALNLRFTTLYPFIRLVRTGWDERAVADEPQAGGMGLIGWQPRIRGARSEFAVCPAILRDRESADHQARRGKADAPHQQETRCHGGFPDFCVLVQRERPV